MDTREQQVVEAFVDLADTLVADFDVVDLLHRLVEDCVGLLDAAQAGLLLADQHDELHVVASSSEQIRLLELFQLQADKGPCLVCFSTGEQVLVPKLADAADRWPAFVSQAQQEGFQSVHAMPLRLRGQTIGAMNLFHTKAGALPGNDLRLGQALADVATIALLQHQAVERGQEVSLQLRTALNSRVAIEQAKGVLAERGNLDMDQAFAALRSYARDNNRRLADVARTVVEDAAMARTLLEPARQHAR